MACDTNNQPPSDTDYHSRKKSTNACSEIHTACCASNV